MKNFNKKEINNSNGITLIALVITIIVLLILAGISISMLSGDNGVLTKTTEAKIKTEKSQIIENAKLDILTQITENKGEDISNIQLATILNKQFEHIDPDTIPNDVSSNDIQLTTIDKKYIINLSEIYNGKLKIVSNKWTYDHNTQTVVKDDLRLKIGTKIEYSGYTDTSYTGDWQILGVGIGDEDGQLLLVSENTIYCPPLNGSNYATTEDAISDLNAAVNELDNKCANFKNDEIATKSRSINAEDINRLTGYDPQNTYLSNSDVTLRGKYGIGTTEEYESSVTYKIEEIDENVSYKFGEMTSFSNTGSMYKKFVPWNNGTTSTDIGVETTVTNRYYFYYINTLGRHSTVNGYPEPGLKSTLEEGYEASNMAYNLIKPSASYWVGTPYCLTDKTGVRWGLHVISTYGSLTIGDLWATRVGACGVSNVRARPVVCLKLDFKPVVKN